MGDGVALGVGQAGEERLAGPRVDDAHRGHEAGDHPHSHKQHCLDASVSNARPEGAPDVVGASIACSQHGEATHPPELLEHSGRERPVEGVEGGATAQAWDGREYKRVRFPFEEESKHDEHERTDGSGPQGEAPPAPHNDEDNDRQDERG